MNNGNLSFQQDENLREALRQEEASLSQMSDDLNDRLMKRLRHEKRRRHLAGWPWVAAACVAAVMVVLWLLPQRETCDGVMIGSGEMAGQGSLLATEKGADNGLQETKDMASPTMVQDGRMANPETHISQIAKTTEREQKMEATTPNMPMQSSSPVANTNKKEQSETAHNTEALLVQEKPSGLPKDVTSSGEMEPADLPRTQVKPQQVVLTERDIPINRPENYHYTPEELALMRRQANEAYVKWMEMELEIMKYQFEQIANQ